MGLMMWFMGKGMMGGKKDEGADEASVAELREEQQRLSAEVERLERERGGDLTDREPVGPYRVKVEPRRTNHVRFDHLQDPAPIPRATPYASLIESDVPIVVQHTRLDSRSAALALLSTIAYGAD